MGVKTGRRRALGHRSAAACRRHHPTQTEPSVFPALLYLILTVTLGEPLSIPPFADVETSSEWLNKVPVATRPPCRRGRRARVCLGTNPHVSGPLLCCLPQSRPGQLKAVAEYEAKQGLALL